MNNFHQLINSINDVHKELQISTYRAINRALTIRNWLIGYYIVEYEQNGDDRAQYGVKLLENLAEKLKHIKGIDERALRNFRQFYNYYNQLGDEIWGSLTPDLSNKLIWGSLTPDLSMGKQAIDRKTQRVKKQDNQLQLPAQVILNKLSYTHIEHLLKISEPLKRTFYEMECIKGTWSVRELKRQISSLYFERSNLSQQPEKLSELVQQKVQPHLPIDIIKNLYSFEFLNISELAIVEESDLESALLTNLQSFIIELGNGFCFEARQKRILIGDTYYFIDLVFYHRILKCHILVELKIGAFEHGDIGQLNTYLNFFKSEIVEATDNPPVGILLVAEKDHALVKFATAGMDENLFVQKYLVNLPNEQQLVKHIENELKQFNV